MYLVTMKWAWLMIGWFAFVGGNLTAQPQHNNSSPNSGEGIVTIDDNIVERNFMPYELEYYCDTTNSRKFNEIINKTFASRFQKHPEYQNKDFRINASYWIKLPIRHTNTTEKAWLLEFYDQTIDYIEAFIPREEGSYER